jgi:hypothetical protein
MDSIENTASTELFTRPSSEPGAQTALSPEVLDAKRKRGKILASFVLGAALAMPAPFGMTGSEWDKFRERVSAENSTVEEEVDSALSQQVRELFDNAATEFFQDGIHTAFSRKLLRLLDRRRTTALRAIARYLFSGSAKPDVVSEALRWIADFGEPATLAQRWHILERTLSDPSPRIRDGAILGFAALDDPRAEPLLSNARNLENIEELRTLIDQVMAQLRRRRK